MKTSEQEIIKEKKGDENTYVYRFHEFYVSLCAYSEKYIGRKDVGNIEFSYSTEEISEQSLIKNNMIKNQKTLQSFLLCHI